MSSNHTDQQAPVQMLKPKVVSDVLGQATTDGVTGAILMTREGAPLAYSGISDHECAIIAAIASNVWSASVKHGQAMFDDELTMQVFDCEAGRMCVCPVTSLLLCVFGAHTVPLGMLRAKTEALCRYLAGPLAEVTSAD